MTRIRGFFKWFGLVYWATLVSLSIPLMATAGDITPRAQLKIMFLFKEGGSKGIQTVENTLIRAFQNQGYSVLDQAMVAQTLQREKELVQLYEIESAKRLGSRLGANMVVSGDSRVQIVEKTPSLLEGKKITVSQAAVSARVILAHSGKVIAAENAHARKPFDNTGDIALEMAAEALAQRLFQGIERFLNRETVEYRLVVFNISHPQSLVLQDGLRQRIQGVRQVLERSFLKDTLELEVSVERQRDLAFKSTLFTQLSALGLGSFQVIASEGEAIYLQRTGAPGSMAPSTSPTGGTQPAQSKGTQPTSNNKTSKARTDEGEHKEKEGSGPPGGPKYQAGYRKSWAVVIGINNYQKWPKLEYAVNDAESVAKLLYKLGFGKDDVIMLLDKEATQQNILRVLGDELYAKTQDEDRVFIFFAGHGQTQDLPTGSKVGYIIPIDGDLNNYYSTAISMRQLQDLSDRLRAKHIFYAMDSCFSGLLLRMRGESPGEYPFLEQTTVRVRQVLTAGSEGEEVVEVGGHGLFTKVLLEALEGKADLNGDGLIPASELYQFLTPRVLALSQNTQNPVFGRLDQGRGEFVFLLNR